MGDHAECTEIDFEPDEVTYTELLEKFFEWHNAFRKPYARQYMSAILYHSEEQRQAIENAVASREDAKRKVRSEIKAHDGFTLAEDYHQKYYLRRNKKVTLELKSRFPTLQEFIDSTACAKANAVLGGFWQPSSEELDQLGFSEESRSQLMNRKKSFFGSLLSSVLPTS